ncbi:hypothetical protein M9Y10_018565 [Tritrichomonas musculus]|uniref:HECT-type E3 ubiquitin transferase n=1 Tax=Tritrichomonas musculus TaxID=1915356 RepID=A0ABR2HNE5_9EUKA
MFEFKKEPEKPLLLSQSLIFKGANIIDCIRQSCIDLNESCDDNTINKLLHEAIQYLDKDCSYDVANELISLIEKCFSCLSTDPLPYLSLLSQKSKKNSYYLITFITVLSYLTKNKPDIDFSQYFPFVDEALTEITPQLQNEDRLILFNHEIPFQYKDDVIINLLLSANITREIMDNFLSYITKDDINNHPKYKSLVEKGAEDGFATDLFLAIIMKGPKNKQKVDTSNQINVKTIDLECDLNEDDETDDFDFISDFLESSNPEVKDDLKKSLFKHMLQEKSNLAGYLQIIFENIHGPSTSPKELLEYFGEEYELDKKMFIEILNNVLVLHPEEKVFITQPKYHQLALIQSNFNKRIINKLFRLVHSDPSNFQAYYCLECIANSFPFIFASNPKQVFEAVLPAFEYFQNIFEKPETNDDSDNDHDDDEEEDVEDENDDDKRNKKLKRKHKTIKKHSNKKNESKGKAAMAATSFLLYTLNSTQVFDEFMKWLFDHYAELSLSQISCILYIFVGCSTSHLMHLMVAYFKKYDIFNLTKDWFQRKVPRSIFGVNFNSLLYKFLLVQHNLDQLLSKYDFLTIDNNSKRNQIFYEGSGNHLTHSIDCIPPLRIQILILDKDSADPMTILFQMVNEDYEPSFLMKSRKKNTISDTQVNDFLQIYESLTTRQEVSKNFTFPELKDDITIRKASLLTTKEPWIAKYIMNQEKFPLLSQHQKLLTEVKDELTAEDKSDHSKTIENYSKKDFLRTYRGSTDCLRIIITRIVKTFCMPDELLIKYFEDIPINSDDYETVFSSFKENFKIIESNHLYFDESTLLEINVNMKLLGSFVKNQHKRSISNYRFNNLFFESFGNDLINFVLKPQYRYNQNVLKSSYNLFKVLNNYPARLLHVIGFMILTKDEHLKNVASLLCVGFDDDKEELINFSLLNKEIINEINSDKPSITFLSNIIKASSDIQKSHRTELLDLLEKLLNNYQNSNDSVEEEEKEEGEDENDDNNEEKIEVKPKDFIVQLLDLLSPDRDNDSTISIADQSVEVIQSENEQFCFCPIPDFIYRSSPQFWQLFIKYRSLINKILLKKFQKNKMVELPGIVGFLLSLSIKQFQSRLVNNYPECFNYDFRSIFFRQSIHNDLNFIKEINLEIDQDNILQDSFNQLHDKKPKDWKQKITISYKDNQGFDAGGLTKDWLTKLTNELINPNLQIFEVSEENQNLIPSRSSFAKSPKGLEMLKFTGMIIARALMQGFLVPAHFTKPFLKQILHFESKVNKEDLMDADPILFDSLEWYRNYDFDNNLETEVYFEINDDEGNTIELVDNGSKKRVTNENKNEYIELRTKHRLIDSISQQVSAFCEGFDSIIPHEKIRMFSPTELNFLICGVSKIDVDDLMQNATYGGSYDIDTPAVKMFFETISKWDDKNLSKLLLFITGTSTMPLNGFNFYKQIGRPIKIIPGGGESRLPCAHTCTNTLELPRYTSEEELNRKLLTAINVSDFQMK